MEEVVKAAFELGIKLGAIFHQFIGTPVSLENAKMIERTMESCLRLQPYVVNSYVNIDRVKLVEKLSKFNYTSLSGDMLYVRVKVKVGDTEVEGELKWDEELKYPLMRLASQTK
ncbi:MAG: dihydroneopterin aldolase family protein [Archaeoglobaceae archaeon]|nr:dihydroneopterin aldolase family protein [Archaeoglobaceae archaeon]